MIHNLTFEYNQVPIMNINMGNLNQYIKNKTKLDTLFIQGKAQEKKNMCLACYK